MPRRLQLITLILLAFNFVRTPLCASALGQLKHIAGSSGNAPPLPAPQAVDPMKFNTSAGGAWTLHCDCSTCSRSWYPDPHPTKGPYASRSACESDLLQVKNRAGASSCEHYYCTGPDEGGASGGGGAGAVESSSQDALRAAQDLAKRNQGDSGRDLLAQEKAEDADNARYGVGRDKNGFRKLGDGPLQVLILKLEPWCGRKAPGEGGAAARAKAASDAGKLADLVSQARARLDGGEIPFQQRQRALRLIDCAERLQDELLAFARPKGKPSAAPKASAKDEGLGTTPQLLREAEDDGGPIDKPYVNCETYKAQAQQLRSGLHVAEANIAKTQAMLDRAQGDADEAHAKGKAQVKDFAQDAVKTAAGEYLGSIHALDKGLSKTMQKVGISREKRKLIFELKEKAEKVQEKAEAMGEAAGHSADFIKAGGMSAYMKGPVDGLQASYEAVMRDPELREELLGYAGENLAGLGGPAAAFAFKAVKTDIDLTALAVSQHLDKGQAEEQLKNLRIMKEQLARNEAQIRFLEEEGKAQCP